MELRLNFKENFMKREVIFFATALIISIIIVSCTLDKMPWDPSVTEEYPPDINTLYFDEDEDTLRWEIAEGDSADGYFVYTAYNSDLNFYEQSDTTFFDVSKIDTLFVWFNVSAFIEYQKADGEIIKIEGNRYKEAIQRSN